MSWFTSNKTSEPAITDSVMESELSPVVTINSQSGGTYHAWVGSNTASNLTWTTVGTGTGGGGSYGGFATGPYQFNNDLKGGKLHLEGDDADIHINGESLMKTLQSLEQRLNILRPNPKLEQQWDQLRALGDQYRQLEAELLEKQQMWDRLKELP